MGLFMSPAIVHQHAVLVRSVLEHLPKPSSKFFLTSGSLMSAKIFNRSICLFQLWICSSFFACLSGGTSVVFHFAILALSSSISATFSARSSFRTLRAS